MRTILGDKLRGIRIKNNQILKDMADTLGVSSAFLSAVENGKKNMPTNWIDILQNAYALSDSECEDIKKASMESQKTITINMKNSSSNNRELAVLFARSFDSIDDETNKKIMHILRNRH